MKIKSTFVAGFLLTNLMSSFAFAEYPKFEWGDTFVSNVALMDSEHKALFETLNTLSIAFQNKNQEDINRLFDAVVDWAVTHFASEEAHMKSEGYAALDAHKKAHDELVKTIQSVTPSVKNGTADGEKIMHELHDWLYDHIPNYDIPAYGHR